jgi:acyl-CoA reductase-like NAD-dependent aldehyde dehydrogenase
MSTTEANTVSHANRALLERLQHHVIGSGRTPSASGETFATLDPATGRTLATVSHGGAEDVDRAVRAARAALDGEWGALNAATRSLLISRLADLVEAHADELAELEALDNGKPVTFARTVDLENAIAHLRYYAGWPTKIEGEVIPVATPDMLCYTRKEPVGVCGQIIPWNYPLMMAAWKVAPVLASGCTTVLKPAEETPLTALRLADLALEAGIPAGVINVVAGDGTTGAALVDHPGVNKIAFTGSTAVGREIGAKASRALKRITLELGGKSPNVITPDADLDAAIQGAWQAIYFNSGQSCNAGSRLYVHKDQFDGVVSALADAAVATVPGPGIDPGTIIGPLVSSAQRERVLAYIDTGRSEGAELVAGGRAIERDGFFVEPTLFTATSDALRVSREEIFGPVLVASPYDSEDEVIARANAGDYGLAAGVWTRDIGAAHRFAAKVQAGMVYLNTWYGVDPAAPFGGVKASGVGREMGHAGLAPYLEEKTVWTNLA